MTCVEDRILEQVRTYEIAMPYKAGSVRVGLRVMAELQEHAALVCTAEERGPYTNVIWLRGRQIWWDRRLGENEIRPWPFRMKFE